MQTLAEYLKQYAQQNNMPDQSFAEANLFNPQVQAAIQADPSTFFRGMGQSGLVTGEINPFNAEQAVSHGTNPYWGADIEGTNGAMSNLMPFNKFSVGAEGGYTNNAYSNAQWLPGKGVVMPANSMIGINDDDIVETMWPKIAMLAMGNVSGGFGLGDLMGSFGGEAAGAGDWASMGGGVDPGTSIVGGAGDAAWGVNPSIIDNLTPQIPGEFGNPAFDSTFADAFPTPSMPPPGNEGDWYPPGSEGAPSAPGAPPYNPTGGESVSGSYPTSPTELKAAAASYSSTGLLPQWAQDLGLTGGDLLKAAVGGAGVIASLVSANTLAKGAKEATNLNRDIYNQARADFEPWRTAGAAAVGRMNDLTTPGKQFDAMQLDPGYQFRLGEGEKGINRGLAARGGWDSGAALKALDRFNRDYATNEFGNVYNRNANLAGLGQVATQGTVGAGSAYGTNAGNAITGGANARASGYMGAANTLAQLIASMSNSQNPYATGR